MTRTPPRAAEGHLALTLPEMIGWGERLGQAAQAPLLITLSGDLGAGKTTLVQAICRGYGVAEEVTSPTFALIHAYTGARTPVYHLDLYRLRDPSELTQLGWDELINERALLLVEWPERAGDRLPVDHLPIELAHLPGAPDRRALLAGGNITATAFGGEDA